MKPILEGTVTDNSQLLDFDLKIKCLIEPDNSYFNQVEKDRKEFDKLILFNGMEPYEFNNIRDNIILYHKNFDIIYSYDDEILKHCPNSKLYSFGSCWILTDSIGNKILKENDFGDFYKIEHKKFKLSFIKSHKNQLIGHQLRHHVPPLLLNRQYEIYYPQYRIECKHELFLDSMFHIVIENAKHDNYFTEKMIDCFMSKTIPIYWGCPNIGDYFNLDGILKFDNLTDLDKILSELSPELFYKLESAINENYENAKEYAFFNKRMNKLITNIL
jgi:hypothetical protein